MFALWYLISLFKGKFKSVKDKDVLIWLELAKQDLAKLPSKSYIKKHLSPLIFKKIYKRQTEFCATLKDVIQGGIANPDWDIGICAPDGESYFVFHELYENFILEYFGDVVHCESHTAKFDNPKYFKVEPDWNKFVLAINIQCQRNVYGFPFLPIITDQQLMELEETLVHVFTNMSGDLKGRYYSFIKMEKEERNVIQEYIFGNKDELMKDLGVYRHWPLGRGVFINDRENLTIRVNEADHLRIICSQKGADLDELYRVYRNAVSAIEDPMEVSYDTKLGYLTLLPSKIGTAMQITITACLPHLSSEKLSQICSRRDLGLEVHDGCCDIFNRRTLGLSESEYLIKVKECVEELIREERSLSNENSSHPGGDFEILGDSSSHV